MITHCRFYDNALGIGDFMTTRRGEERVGPVFRLPGGSGREKPSLSSSDCDRFLLALSRIETYVLSSRETKISRVQLKTQRAEDDRNSLTEGVYRLRSFSPRRFVRGGEGEEEEEEVEEDKQSWSRRIRPNIQKL